MSYWLQFYLLQYQYPPDVWAFILLVMLAKRLESKTHLLQDGTVDDEAGTGYVCTAAGVVLQIEINGVRVDIGLAQPTLDEQCNDRDSETLVPPPAHVSLLHALPAEVLLLVSEWVVPLAQRVSGTWRPVSLPKHLHCLSAERPYGRCLEAWEQKGKAPLADLFRPETDPTWSASSDRLECVRDGIPARCSVEALFGHTPWLLGRILEQFDDEWSLNTGTALYHCPLDELLAVEWDARAAGNRSTRRELIGEAAMDELWELAEYAEGCLGEPTRNFMLVILDDPH